jgi:hypothetical protein
MDLDYHTSGAVETETFSVILVFFRAFGVCGAKTDPIN